MKESMKMILKKNQFIFQNSTYFAGIENSKRIITGSNSHAFIKIAEGCNQKCSFCAIPSFKGKLKSREISSIIAELKDLVARGYKDFLLSHKIRVLICLIRVKMGLYV